MLIVRIHNDGTGTKTKANYNCDVAVTTSPTEFKTLWKGQVKGFRRERGWRELLHEVLQADEEETQAMLREISGARS